MIRNAIQRFMYGRYGTDQLNIALLVLYLVLYLVSALIRLEALYWLSLVVLVLLVFRTLSRNPARRRAAEIMAFISACTERHSSYRSPEGMFMASRVQKPRSMQFFRPRGAPL